jgi:adenylate cyclase
MMDAMRRDAEGLRQHAEEIMQVAGGTVVPWMESGARYRGEALLLQDHLQMGIAETRRAIKSAASGGYHCFESGTYCTLADTHSRAGHPEKGLAVIEEALSFIQNTDERHWEAEIHRTRAELLLAAGDETGAEASYQKAIAVARRQRARSWELRASIGLARFWKEQGKVDQARELLAGIYGWFSEGFETADLREAKGLLGEMGG